MPELPEVETVVRDLIPLLALKTIVKVEVPGKKLRRPWNPLWSQLLENQTIEKVTRRGKWIIISLRSNLPAKYRVVVHPVQLLISFLHLEKKSWWLQVGKKDAGMLKKIEF